MSVQEAAVTPQAAAGMANLALFPSVHGNKGGVLFDWAKALQSVEGWLKEIGPAPPETNKAAVNEFRRRFYMRFVQWIRENTLGYIDCKKLSTPERTWTVKFSAAEKGWGPLMYDLAMSMVSPEFLTSDRINVSKDAERVWAYYFTNRPDVEKKLLSGWVGEIDFDQKGDAHPRFPLDPGVSDVLRRNIATMRSAFEDAEDLRREIMKARVEQNEEQEDKLMAQFKFVAKNLESARTFVKKSILTNPFLYKYRTKQPTNINSLISNGQKFVETLASKYGVTGITSEMIVGLGEHFFNYKYKD